jgi:hypothetical protein
MIRNTNKTTEKKKDYSDRGFLLDLWNTIFAFLEKLSIFYIVRKITKSKSYKFVDGWILGNLLAGILSTILVYNLSQKSVIIIYIVITYAMLRVFEVIIYQINVLLFHPYRAHLAGKKYEINSIPRMVVSLLHNYVEIMFWYSSIVISLVVLNEGAAFSLTWSNYIKSNILCIATLDGSAIKETLNTSYSYLSNLIFVELISGIIMTVICLARFIGILPGVAEKNKYEG